MQVRIFTLRFNPVTESFDDSTLVGFVADKDVLSIRDHFFVKDHIPYLTVVVHYRTPILPTPTEANEPTQKHDESWRDKLMNSLLIAVKRRKRQAKSDGLDVLTDAW